jgi:hypothetical protein
MFLLRQLFVLAGFRISSAWPWHILRIQRDGYFLPPPLSQAWPTVPAKRCDELLNPQLDAWRKREVIAVPSDHAVPGTFDWMVTIYKTHPWYTKKLAKTRKSYDAVLNLISKHLLKDGRTFGSLPLPQAGLGRRAFLSGR